VAFDWNKIKFLESTTNLKSTIKQSTGLSPSTETARDISACLQQGRLFFEIAESAPLQVRPLQLYYGIVGFAKAIILARNVRSIATIAQSHGLSDISAQNAKIENLRLRFDGKGVFQQFNDVIAPLGRINYYDDSTMLQSEAKPFDLAAGLNQTECSLKDLLARIPGLQKPYRRTFNQDPECWPVQIQYSHGHVSLRLDDPHLFADKSDLRARVVQWRRRFPWLNDWCFSEALRAWNNSILIFVNFEKPMSGELSDAMLVPNNSGFSAKTENQAEIYFASILPVLAGGLTLDHQTAIHPLNGVTLSEFALQFGAVFLLSSLVRYRPQLWQHAVSHSASQNRATDDRSLSLIESCMSGVLGSFPALAENCIDPVDQLKI
jgi:YaaC-like Protein